MVNMVNRTPATEPDALSRGSGGCIPNDRLAKGPIFLMAVHSFGAIGKIETVTVLYSERTHRHRIENKSHLNLLRSCNQRHIGH